MTDGTPAERPGARRLAGDVRRQQIRQEAARLFDRLGYRETSMERIAEAVGVRKASLYYYFPSKDRLLAEMHDEMIDRILSAHADRTASGATPSQLLLGMMTDLVSLQETHPGSLRVFFENYHVLPEPEHLEVAERRNRYEGQVREVLAAGVAAGEFRPLDPAITAFAILGMCNWSYQWFRSGERLSAAEVAQRFWAIAMSGIAAV